MLMYELLIIVMCTYILFNNILGIKSLIMMLMFIGVGMSLYHFIGILGIWMVVPIIVIYLILLTKKITISMMIPCIAVIISVIVNHIYQVISLYLLNGINVESYFIRSVLIVNFLSTVLFCLLIRYFFKRLRAYRVLEACDRRGLQIFLILLLGTYYLHLDISEKYGTSHENFLFNSLLFVFYVCLLFVLFMHVTNSYIKDLNEEQEQNKGLQEYTAQLEQLYDDLSGFRHDYINILLTLKESIYLEDIQTVKDIYETIIKPTEHYVRSNNYVLGKLRNLTVNEVKSILAAKISHAQAQKITIKLEIVDKIEDIYMDLVDFCRIFAILLDNAIEAAVEVESPFISIALIQDRGHQRIEIENNCLSRDLNLKEITKKGVSSKGKHRGHGLYIVNQLLEKNRYVTLETSYQSRIFTQSLTIKKYKS